MLKAIVASFEVVEVFYSLSEAFLSGFSFQLLTVHFMNKYLYAGYTNFCVRYTE